MDNDVTDWLLASDPALRWQVERDLLGAPEETWRATRARVATEGFGAQLLSLQDEDGQWAGGAYFPQRHDPRAFDPKGTADVTTVQPWNATTWSLNALREWGLEAAVLGDTAERLARNSRWEYDDLPYWGGEVDCCINAFTLANGTWLGADVAGLADWFVEHQLDDGGWNCEWVEGATTSSFHSTLNSLEGLLYREQAGVATEAQVAARRRGEEYLLSRRLMFRMRDGALVGEWTTRFAYPPRWSYTVLRAADYFRAAGLYDDTPPDPRLADAMSAIEAKRQLDGRWLQDRQWPGLVWFDVDVPEGEPSRWLTTFAARTLAWWQIAG